nr:hypothetical protein [Tanacetum cinerariifolium]
YDGYRLLQPGHAPVTVSDSHETLLETELSRMKMSQKPGHVTPVDYTKLNALYDQFVPQKELSREQVYWLSASDIASQSSDPPKPMTPFVHTRPVNSKEFKHIFDELDSEYEQTILANKNLQIEKKNILIKNECLISDSISKDICFIVLASVNIVPPISDCMCAELRTSCDREHNRVLELEAEISKLHNMLKESKKRCVFIQKDHIDLQVKFQNYKECLRNQKVCEQPNASASNAIIKINKLKAQLQKKDDTIRHLHTEKDIIGTIQSQYHLRTTSLEKIAIQKAEIATLKAEAIGKKNSGPIGTPTKPEVLASGMYTKSS